MISRNRLSISGCSKEPIERIEVQFRERGCTMTGRQFVDSTLAEVPSQHSRLDENAQLKNLDIPRLSESTCMGT